MELGATHLYKKSVIDRWVDSLEKAKVILRIRNLPREENDIILTHMKALFNTYPETKGFYHWEIAELLGRNEYCIRKRMNKKLNIYRRGYKKKHEKT